MALTTVAHTPGGAAGPPAPGGAPGGRGGRRATPYLLLLPGLLWLALFFAVPIVTLLSTSLQTAVPSGEIGVFEQTWRFANYPEAISGYTDQLFRSFQYAAMATVLTFLIGYPLAYTIAFKAGRWRNLLLVLVIAPFFTSFLLRTVAWKQIFADEWWVSRSLKFVGLIPDDYALTASTVAVVTGLTYNFLPFMVLPLYASIERIDPRLIEAGGDLYGSPFTVLRKVTLPLSAPGIIAGTLLTFIPAAGDYINAQLLGRRDNRMLGNVIDSRFFQVVDYPTAAVLSFVLMTAILVLVALYIRRAGTEELV